MGASGGRHAGYDGIDLFLGESCEGLGCLVGGLYFGANLLNGSQVPVFKHREWLAIGPIWENWLDVFVRRWDDMHAEQFA